ncbi:MAG: hypothetical protein RL077_4147 [Verrucomicrobiota bacterium]|jgi:hypothetical protein
MTRDHDTRDRDFLAGVSARVVSSVHLPAGVGDRRINLVILGWLRLAMKGVGI